MADYLVTTLEDKTADDGVLSLREAIAAANAGPGADGITFDASIAGGTIHLGAAGQLTITDALTVAGGPLGILLDANADGDNDAGTHLGTGDQRAIGITAGSLSPLSPSVTLSDLTITGGHTDGDTSQGGGILTTGPLTLERVHVENNSTSGVFSPGGGVASVQDNMFQPGDLTIIDSTISGNATAGEFGFGGGVYGDGTVTVQGSVISANGTSDATARGGASMALARSGSPTVRFPAM